MTAKQTYSVRLDSEQRMLLAAMAENLNIPVGVLIRHAIDAYLKQQEEKEYLSEVEERIAATMNRLARQVAKDRAEQQLIVGMLDYLREWLSFTLPIPDDKEQANYLMRERDKVFWERLPLQFTNMSRAKVTTIMEEKTRDAQPCPVCGTGSLFPKEGKKGIYWYCSNLRSTPKCEATFSDVGGRPLLSKEVGSM